MRPPCSLPRQGHNQIIVLNQELKSNIIQFRWSLNFKPAMPGKVPMDISPNQGTFLFSKLQMRFPIIVLLNCCPQFNPRNQTVQTVEGLYCKRPIRCLASSEILTPTPSSPGECIPPPLVRREDTLAGWRGGGGSIVRKTPDTALESVLNICNYFVVRTMSNSWDENVLLLFLIILLTIEMRLLLKKGLQII